MIDCKERSRAVSTKEAKEAASRLGVDYIEASSLESINIDKVNSMTLLNGMHTKKTVFTLKMMTLQYYYA